MSIKIIVIDLHIHFRVSTMRLPHEIRIAKANAGCNIIGIPHARMQLAAARRAIRASLVPIKILAAYRKIAQTKLRMEMPHAFAPSYFLDYSYWNTPFPRPFH